MGDFVVSEPGTSPPPGAERLRQSDWVTPGMFAAFGIAIDAGRDFDERDTPATPKVMIVNEAFARRFSPGASPIEAANADHTGRRVTTCWAR